jgi:hypothetical protein
MTTYVWVDQRGANVQIYWSVRYVSISMMDLCGEYIH